MRGFYEDYRKEKQSGDARDRPAMIRRNAGMAVAVFFSKLFTAVLYLTATILSSVGLTTLINKLLRDMLFDIARSVFLGG